MLKPQLVVNHERLVFDPFKFLSSFLISAERTCMSHYEGVTYLLCYSYYMYIKFV